jgi:hypothetical protein
MGKRPVDFARQLSIGVGIAIIVREAGRLAIARWN